MPPINITIPVTVENGQPWAPDTDIPDVGTNLQVVITWSGDGVELTGITGLPSNVRVSSPSPFNTITGTYFSPSSEDTWNYTILGTVEGEPFSHDPRINNTTPT